MMLKRWYVRSCLVYFLLICFGFSSVEIHAAVNELYFSVQEKAAMALLLKITKDFPTLSSTDLRKIADQVTENLNFEVKNIEVDSYQHYLQELKKDDIFSTTSLEKLSYEQLGELLQPRNYFSSSPRIQNKIYNIEQNKKQKALEFLSTFNEKIGELALGKLNQQDLFEHLKDGTIVESIKNQVKNFTDEFVQKFTDKMLEKSQSAQVKILVQLIKQYFDYLPLKLKFEMMYQVIQKPILTTSSLDIFLVFLQNSGPQLQKLLQIIGRSPEIPIEFQTLFQKLESQVKPVPWLEVRSLLIKNKINMNQFSYFEKKPVGVGTMAQAHRAQMKENDQSPRRSVIIRILKPGIRDLIEMDHQILTKIARSIDSDATFKKYDLPSLLNIVNDIHASVMEESVVENTVSNQKKGEKVYNRKFNIKYDRYGNVLELHTPYSSLMGQDVMLQELVFGQKPYKEIKTYAEVYPSLYSKVAEAVAQIWIEEAFFKSGFFHSDLHQGNIMMNFADEKITLNILDFGMVGQLDSKKLEAVLKLVFAIKILKADVIAQSFIEISKSSIKGPWTIQSIEEFKDKVNQRVSSINTQNNNLQDWTAWALKSGLILDYEFLKLNRGVSAIKILLTDAKSKLTFEQIAESVALKNKVYVINTLFRGDAFKSKDFLKAIRPQNHQTLAQNKCLSLFEVQP